MAIFYNGEPLNGSALDDLMFSFPLNGAASTINGLGGDDLIFGDADYLFVSDDLHFGTDSITAYSLSAATTPWSLYENSDILNATTVPHATIVFLSTGGSDAWWKVTVGALETITLDIDYGDHVIGGATDTVLRIYATDGTTELASNDNAAVSLGGSGSTSSADAFLQYTFLTAGTYFIRAHEAGADAPFEPGDSFVLNVSLTGQSIAGGSPVSGADIITGGAGVDVMRGGGGADIFQLYDSDGAAAGEVYDGGSDADTLRFLAANSATFDLRDDTLSSIAQFDYTDPGTGATLTVQVLANQIGPGLSATGLVNGNTFTDVTDVFSVTMGTATTLDLSGLTFADFTDGADAVLITGDGEAETITGSHVRDTITAGGGNDVLDGGAQADTLIGGAGNDRYIYDLADTIIEAAFSAGGGIDTLISTAASVILPTNVEILRLGGTAAIKGFGTGAYESLVGNSGANELGGGGGNDTINGKGGADILRGGTGQDTLIGEAGSDTFDYDTVADSRAGSANRDFINGFVRGEDKIDLSTIDASTLAANDQAFRFLGTTAFGTSGAASAGQVRISFTGTTFVILDADVHGDGIADMQIVINGVTALGAADFVL